MNKLDIEFEDDEEIRAREEAERKKNEVVEDVDIDFGVDDSSTSAEASPEKDEAQEAVLKKGSVKEDSALSESQEKHALKEEEGAKKIKERTNPQENIKPIEKAREKKKVQAEGQEEAIIQRPQYQQIPQAQVMIEPDYKLGDELKKFAASNQVFAIELEARVKVEVTKEITKTVADFHAQNKLLEHKVNKLLTQIHQKAPALKNELMTIKKLLKEHCSLDRDENKEDSLGPGKGSATQREGAQNSKKPIKKKAA